jgi:hypothetical protein
MKCWCADIGYTCLECEKENKWGLLKDSDKAKLLKYLYNQETDTMNWLNENSLCVSMVPDRYCGNLIGVQK